MTSVNICLAFVWYAEGALHIFGPLGFRAPNLLGGGPHPLEPAMQNRRAAKTRNFGGKYRRLVEAARPLPVPMQRNRDERIGSGQQLAPGARHPPRQQRRKSNPVAV